MRTSLALVSLAALTTLAGCTLKDVEAPPLAGPSTYATEVSLRAQPDQLFQNGTAQSRIEINAIGPNGEQRAVTMRAQIFVDGIAQDFGVLDNKRPTTPATITYTAPPPSNVASGQTTTVQIGVSPEGTNFGGETMRFVQIQLLPVGVILPTNPGLLPQFTITPPDPQAFTTVTFDASGTTNGGSRCLSACAYSWSFGDNTSGSGMVTTHQFRTPGNFAVTLTVTDSRGAQSAATQSVPVTPATPPTATFRFSPSAPGVNQPVFFSADPNISSSGRSIARWDWDFGDGSSGGGSTVVHSYSANGSYNVTLRATDEVGVVGSSTQTISVSLGNPTVTATVTPSAPRVNQNVTVNIVATPAPGSSIATYRINWGDGSPVDEGSASTQSHMYGGAGNVTITVTAVDTFGRSTTVTVPVVIAP